MGTEYLVYWLAVTAERVFSGMIKLLIPEGAYWPGLGLVTGLLVLYLIGLVVNAYFVRSALRMSDRLFARIPVVKTIYLTIRDFMRFFPSSGQGGDLKRVEMVPFGPGKAIGFVTAESGAALGIDDARGDTVAVYLPMSYMVGGYTVFLPREAIEPTSLSVEAGMRIALMGDLKYGRTVHSLAHALSLFYCQLQFLAPIGLEMPAHIKRPPPLPTLQRRP